MSVHPIYGTAIHVTILGGPVAVSEEVEATRLTDEDANGRADGIESTNADAAVITSINGEATGGVTGERDVPPNADGHIEVTVDSDAADCAAVVCFDDANDDRALNVDAEGLPAEDWGFSWIEWAD